jgi:hypothetical protein
VIPFGVFTTMLATQSTCFAPYFYRVNPDKTLDSVCTRCFEASSAASHPSMLREWESAHHCIELSASVDRSMSVGA